MSTVDEMIDIIRELEEELGQAKSYTRRPYIDEDYTVPYQDNSGIAEIRGYPEPGPVVFSKSDNTSGIIIAPLGWGDNGVFIQAFQSDRVLNFTFNRDQLREIINILVAIEEGRFER